MERYCCDPRQGDQCQPCIVRNLGSYECAAVILLLNANNGREARHLYHVLPINISFSSACREFEMSAVPGPQWAVEPKDYLLLLCFGFRVEFLFMLCVVRYKSLIIKYYAFQRPHSIVSI